MVQFRALRNNKENRRVRDVIIASGLTINVYEPSIDDVNKILDLQERWVSVDDPQARQVSGVDMVRELFPILSDVEGIDELTDEEVQEIADEPIVAYIQLQTVIETVLSEIFQTHVLVARKRLVDANYNYEAEKVNRDAFNTAMSLEIKNTGATDIVDKINKMTEEIEGKVKDQEVEVSNERVIQLEKVKEETDKKINGVKEYNNLLADYRKASAAQKNKSLDKDK